nr:zinc finger, CCHC-type [Tanacetum cinerariifolium]
MGDENHIRTLGDYSRPSHEGYMNTIELSARNNVVPLRFDTIRLVQNECSFHELRSEDPNQHLKDFIKVVDSLDLDGRTTKLCNVILMFQQHHGESLSEAWTRFKDLLQKVPHHGIDCWLQIQIFYDHVDNTTQKGIDYAVSGRLRKLKLDEAWAAIERLAQYKNEGWNDAFITDEASLNYENFDIEKLLGIMERKVNTLMKDAISSMGEIESIFRLTTNEIYRPPLKPSRQEEFEHIVMNFILDQEERARQLKDYMLAIAEEFIEFSSEVAKRHKEMIKENKNKPRKIEKITKYPDTKVLENSAKRDLFKNLKKRHFLLLKISMRKTYPNNSLESASTSEEYLRV